jgi:cell wall-associated NlpC family hydrolase
MRISQKPSTGTEGSAMAFSGRAMSPTGALRLLVVALALLGTLAVATPASAQEESLNASGSGEAPAGQAIVDFALGYVGYPYVWAGNTPAGFDCSGFTQYVIMNTIGIDIGHGTAGQTGYGAPVDWDAWQPGDLVFFANTSDAGISHVGIYIGDGQFVHAENESTGVTISSLYSDYYSGHYYGAYRIG